MADFYEIDFLDVETDCSGDAIILRYEIGGQQTIHVVDGGFQVTGEAVVTHLTKYYATNRVDHVVVTHCDRDHAGGLRKVLEELDVGTLWMLRPWLFAEDLIHRFPTYSSVDKLRSRLRSIFGNLVALEDIALARGIPIKDAFQGTTIGAFTVLAPSKDLYLDLVVSSEKTPESVDEANAALEGRISVGVRTLVEKVVSMVQAAWGEEIFPSDETSAENEMSLVQFARLSGHTIVLTGDSGRRGLQQAADYAPMAGLTLPGVDRIQVPHHGSRRNVSTELLDAWLGPRLAEKPAPGTGKFSAIVSSAKADKAHPRKAVKRAFIHRGANFYETESRTLLFTGGAAPARGWTSVAPAEYPDEQED